MPALSDFDISSLEAELKRRGCKPSHASRILRAFYKTNGNIQIKKLQVGRKIEQLVGSEIAIRQSKVLLGTQSTDGTVKLLLGLDRGGTVETVMMPGYRIPDAAGCLSCQIGCAMGCDFCASTASGLDRNLEGGEMVEQYLHLKHEARTAGRRIRTVVFMGMGEPMHNLKNVLAAIRRIAGPGLGHLGWRQITVSTVGIVPGIDDLAESGLGVFLAVSLHAADDQTRAGIIPSARKYPIQQIIDAAQRYQRKTRRTVNIEYCLLEGVNDSDDHATALAKLLHGRRMHVNLIPYNPIGGEGGYRRPTAERLTSFGQVLLRNGIVAHIRRTRGDDVGAACGQLRALRDEVDSPT